MRKPAPVVVQFAGFVAAALALAACDITIGASEYSVREEKKFAVSGQARLSLSTFDGSIEVRGWDRNEVVVEVEKVGPDQKTVDRIQVKATQDGNAITIDVPKPSPLETTGMRRTPSANLAVSVPLQTAVLARSGDGSIEIRRVSGKIDVDTEDGNVHVEEVTGDFVIRTGDGAVDARRVEGGGRVNTRDGNIRADGMFTSLSLETGDGAVDLDGRVEGDTRIHTGDGNVRARGVFTSLTLETGDGAIDLVGRDGTAVASDWTVTTGDGNITLELPAGVNADLDAQTSDGHVDAGRLAGQGDQPSSGEARERRSVRAKLGAGGKALKIRSGSGSITIRGW
jgi:hypothetical protein